MLTSFEYQSRQQNFDDTKNGGLYLNEVLPGLLFLAQIVIVINETTSHWTFSNLVSV